MDNIPPYNQLSLIQIWRWLRQISSFYEKSDPNQKAGMHLREKISRKMSPSEKLFSGKFGNFV